MPRSSKSNDIPRPPNAFILFRGYLHRTMRSDGTACSLQSDFSKIAASRWRALDPAAQKVFYDQANEARAKHKEKYPLYSFHPARKVPTPSSHKKRTKAKSVVVPTGHGPVAQSIQTSGLLDPVAAVQHVDSAGDAGIRPAHSSTSVAPHSSLSFDNQPVYAADPGVHASAATVQGQFAVYNPTPEDVLSQAYSDLGYISNNTSGSGLVQIGPTSTATQLAPNTTSAPFLPAELPADFVQPYMQAESSLWAYDPTLRDFDFALSYPGSNWAYQQDDSVQFFNPHSSSMPNEFFDQPWPGYPSF